MFNNFNVRWEITWSLQSLSYGAQFVEHLKSLSYGAQFVEHFAPVS